VQDGELAAFFQGLVSGEARHHRAYVDLAERVAPVDEVSRRLDELARHEAAVLAGVPALPRLHA